MAGTIPGSFLYYSFTCQKIHAVVSAISVWPLRERQYFRSSEAETVVFVLLTDLQTAVLDFPSPKLTGHQYH